MGKRILLVEDEEILSSLYKQELEEEGYEIVEARNGKEGLGYFEIEKPDLVVLDIVMPLMNGIETLGRMKEKNGNIPIILHSAHAEFSIKPEAQAADSFVLKSSDLAPLKEKIHEILDRDE